MYSHGGPCVSGTAWNGGNVSNVSTFNGRQEKLKNHIKSCYANILAYRGLIIKENVAW